MTSTPTCSAHRHRGSAGCWCGRASTAKRHWPARRAGPTTWSTRWPTCPLSSTSWPDLDRKAPLAEEHQYLDHGAELEFRSKSGPDPAWLLPALLQPVLNLQLAEYSVFPCLRADQVFLASIEEMPGQRSEIPFPLRVWKIPILG